MAVIDWEPPAPRAGFAGSWDRFMGPGATGAEEAVQVVLGVAISAGCIGLFWLGGGFGSGWLTIAVAVVLALDLGGGLVTNATSAAKRWYHRKGYGRAAHLRFVAVHGLHIAAVAWLMAGQGWLYFGLAYGFLLGAAVLITSVPLYLQRPVALGLAGLGILMAQLPELGISGLGWFLPLLWLKLLVAHLVKEAPFAADQRGADA